MTKALRVLALTGGHSYDKTAFKNLLDNLPFDITWWEPTDLSEWFAVDRLADFDVNLHYDMPGGRLIPEDPSPRLISGIRDLVSAGHGFVVMHHALASWPSWPEWSELVGGKYLYAPGIVRGQPWPDSGFRHDVKQHLSPIGSHPVLAGLEAGFDVCDETYLCPMFVDDVTPLLRTNALITDEVHTSTSAALISGDINEPIDPTWHHPPGSPLAAWCLERGSSRWVYVQPGDTGQTLRDPQYQRLISNAVNWTGGSHI